MNLNELSVFVRVVDSGSFTKAAKFLKQPKSRVSRKISALERDLGVTLLYRTTRQFRPTEAGLALYRECREHVYALEGASKFIKEHSNEVSGNLRITAAEDFGTALLGPIIDEITTLHPKLSVDAQFSNEYVDLIRDGFDLAVRIGPLEDATLIARQIGYVSLILVASPNYLSKVSPIESLSDLSKHPTLDFAIGQQELSVWQLQNARKKEYKIEIQPRCRASNPQILVTLACLDKGVALVPTFLCYDLIQSGKLQQVLSAYRTPADPVHFVWPSQKEMSPKVKAFVEIGLKHLTKYFSESFF